MSHGEPSESHHGEHQKRPEPNRVTIADPGKSGVDYLVVNPVDFTTTHRDPHGNYYTIGNKSPAEALWRLGVENKRNAQLEYAAKNDLYRIDSEGQFIRPAASSEDFTSRVADADVETVLGNYDIGNPDDLVSYYDQGENGSNELAAIAEHSASIVESYTARDAALAEGKTLEEAQVIGSEVYLKQERLKGALGKLAVGDEKKLEEIATESPTIENEPNLPNEATTRLGEKAFKLALEHWDDEISLLIKSSGLTDEQKPAFFSMLYTRIGNDILESLRVDNAYTDQVVKAYADDIIKKGEIVGGWLPDPLRDRVVEIAQGAIKTLLDDIANNEVTLEISV